MNSLDFTSSFQADLFYAHIVPLFAKHSLSRSIYVVARLQIPELLENEPLDIKTIAHKLACPVDILQRILNYVAAQKIFKKNAAGCFKNTESSLQLRRKALGAAIMADQDANWHRLGCLSEEFTLALSSQDEAGELWRLARGYILSRAVYAAAVLGIDNVYQQAPYAALFKQANLVQDQQLTAQGKLLRHPGCRQFFMHETKERWLALGELEMAVRTGKVPFFELYGKSFFDFLKESPHSMKNFDSSMTFITECELTMVKPNIQKHFAPGQIIVDVGGGQGAFLAGLLDGHPEMSGILFDLEQTVMHHAIPKTIQKQVTIWGGDFFQSVPMGNLYVIKRVLHDWSNEESITILKNCRKHSKEGAKLLLNEFALPHPIAQSIDINMAAFLNGRQRTIAEFEELCQKAGWQVVEITSTACGITTFTAV